MRPLADQTTPPRSTPAVRRAFAASRPSGFSGRAPTQRVRRSRRASRLTTFDSAPAGYTSRRAAVSSRPPDGTLRRSIISPSVVTSKRRSGIFGILPGPAQRHGAGLQVFRRLLAIEHQLAAQADRHRPGAGILGNVLERDSAGRNEID